MTDKLDVVGEQYAKLAIEQSRDGNDGRPARSERTREHDRPSIDVRRKLAPELAPESAAFSGLAGDVVDAIAPNTEADPAGLLVVTLAAFGSMVGGKARTMVGATPHPPTLFVAQVGRTSRARKDTATAEIMAVMYRVEEGWHEEHMLSGFGSGEAFIEQAAECPGEAILMKEPELARPLAAASRDGSTLSSVLRSAWGFERLEHRIRKTTYKAPPAPVTLIGHITVGELKDSRVGLRPVDCMNGFGNRILWDYVDRRRTLPSPRPVPEHVLTPLVGRLRSALELARRAGAMKRSADGDELWEELYVQMGADEGWGLVDELTARAEAQVLRLSLIYALLDCSATIERRHIEAAWEVWRYCRWSAQHIWVGEGTGDPDLDRLVAVLEAGDDLTGRELDKMFPGRRVPDLRAKAIELGVAQEEQRETTGGRPPIVLTSADKGDKGDKVRWWTSVRFRREALSPLSALSVADAHDP